MGKQPTNMTSISSTPACIPIYLNPIIEITMSETKRSWRQCASDEKQVQYRASHLDMGNKCIVIPFKIIGVLSLSHKLERQMIGHNNAPAAESERIKWDLAE